MDETYAAVGAALMVVGTLGVVVANEKADAGRMITASIAAYLIGLLLLLVGA